MNSTQSNVLFSIIIPLYNAEKHLTQCLNSILKQNNSKLEIILVNDCSKDKTKKICNLYKKKNKTIKILNNHKRLGVSESRNRGIRVAKGNFLIFLDGDDFLIDNCIKDLRKLAEKNVNCDLIIAQKFIALSMPNTVTVNSVFEKKLLSKKNYEKMINGLNKQNKIYGNIYNYIINRKFLIKKKIYFTANINYAEDREFVVKILCFCKRFCFHKKSFYCFRSGAGNLSNAMSLNIGFSCLKVINNLCMLLKFSSLSKNKKQLIKNSIKHILQEFIPRLLCFKENEILKLSKYMQSKHSNFELIKFKFLEIEITNTLKRYGHYKGLLLYKLAITKKIIKIFEKQTLKKIYIFCSNYYSVAVVKILLKNRYNVEGILDNNRTVVGKKILGKKIYLPHFLSNKTAEYKSNVFVLITNQSDNNIKEITNQLVTIGINKKKIAYKIF